MTARMNLTPVPVDASSAYVVTDSMDRVLVATPRRTEAMRYALDGSTVAEAINLVHDEGARELIWSREDGILIVDPEACTV